MTWQEYQEAVARFYEQAEGLGEVRRNVYLPDRITGQPRQIDVLLEVEARGHPLRIVIDAKYRREKIDVKDLEEALSLAKAVGANKTVIVASDGWTAPAETKAAFAGAELLLLSIDEALDLLVPDKWALCDACQRDCVVMSFTGGDRVA